MDCPACGTPVTLEVGPERPISTPLSDAILGAEEDERIEMTTDCWNCGWHETRELRVESIDTTAGDVAAIERASLVDEITNEIAGIEDSATLEDVLAEIRRQRESEAPVGDTGDGFQE
ncbi:hypothetical protein ACFQL1_23770 [Halomicroarcula sp. GCM10025709]|uniref:hypothetical protein n=1 Tax=Haloarcula TaxID=2237 RepID=UPI0024C39329|nr:hypothetical protein [Halomicroarcula sp. YJ-61-S]